MSAKNSDKNGDLYSEYLDRFNTDGDDRLGGEEDVDDFISKLRNDSTLEDMAEKEPAEPSASFSESEAAREPVPTGSDADLVLGSGDSGTAVFKTDDADGQKKKSTVGAKKTITKKPAAKKSASPPRKKRVITDDKGSVWMRILRVVVYAACGLALVFCVIVIAAAMYLSKVTVNDDALLDLNAIKLGQSTRIMAMDPETGEYEEVARIFGEENRVWVTYDEFPQSLIDAAVASEDERFWKHDGVDIKRTIGAFINEYIYPIWGDATQGGSTITQQLIKNILEEDEVEGGSGALRKLREIYRAYQLERRFTKEQILEAYLNTFRLSGQVAGIEAGANYYFNKTTKELSAAESAAIVCITKFPGANNPFTNPGNNKIQRDYVLSKMNELGYLSDSEYRQYLQESAGFVFDEPGTLAGSATEVYSYFTDLIIEEVLADLMSENDLTAVEAEDLLFNGGLVIYSTMNPYIQEVVERVALDEPDENGNRQFPDIQYITTESQLAEEKQYPGAPEDLAIGDPRVNQVQGGIVVMDYEGQILGVAGGLREKTVSRGTNRATTPRQTGSAIKPLSVYAPGIEFNTIHYSSWFPDTAASVVNGYPWPRNYDHTYGSLGAIVTVYDGVRVSLNTTAVFALMTLGADVSFDFLRTNLGVTTLGDGQETDTNGNSITDRALAPLAMGSLSYGISAIEMAAAYAVFGNGGQYTEPHCYTVVTDTSGATIILDKESTLIQIQAISEQTAYIMNRLLQVVMYSGTGTNALPRNTNLSYAGKTGTTSDNAEVWICGMNPYYVCVSWMGYDFLKYYRWGLPRPPQKAFRAIMSEISADLPDKSFPARPSGITTLAFCRQSGLIASGGCPEPVGGFYKDGNVPTEVCEHSAIPIVEVTSG